MTGRPRSLARAVPQSSAVGDGELQISFRPQASVLAEVRRQLREWLEGCGAPGAVVEELVLSAGELCANAVEATEEGMIQLDARCDGSAVHLAVSNPGNVTDADLVPATDDQDPTERGRGLVLVRAFTDSLAIVNVDGRTVARAVRLLPG